MGLLGGQHLKLPGPRQLCARAACAARRNVTVKLRVLFIESVEVGLPL